MTAVHDTDKTNTPKDTLEQVGDVQEVREPHDPATRIWGPPKEICKTSKTDRRASEHHQGLLRVRQSCFQLNL